MATITGSATDRTDFLNKLVAFAVTVGYTDLGTTTEGVDTVWHLLKGGYYFHFRPRQAGALLHVDLKLSLAWTNELYNVIPNGSFQSSLSFYGLAGPYVAHKFFSNVAGDYIYVAVEVASGVFNHWAFGVGMDKNEPWVGGGFSTGGYYVNATGHIGTSAFNCMPFTAESRQTAFPGTVHFELAGAPSIWTQFKYLGGTHFVLSQVAPIGAPSFYSPLLLDAPGPVAPEAQVHPMELFNGESDGGLFIPLGAFLDVGVVNIENLTPDTIFTVGSDQWHMYPITEKNGSNTLAPDSGNMGIAYKIVP